MIAGYIKFFTRWMNGWIYGISALSATCIKSLVILFVQYSFGSMFTLIGHEDVSLRMTMYLDSISEFMYAGILIQIVAMVFFTWYYLNSSIDPVIRIKTVAPDRCKLENFEIQLNELKEKSGKESIVIKEIKNKYEEEKKKSTKATQENKGLKEKIKENDADKKKIEKLQDSIKERDNDIEIKACNLDKLQITLQASREDVDRCKNEYSELETKFYDAIKQLDVKDCTINDLEDAEKEFNTQLSNKDEEIKEKEDLIRDLYDQISNLEKQIINLEESLEEEKRLSHKIKLEKDVLEETAENINKISESTNESVTDGESKNAEQLKAEKLAMLTDASKIKEELCETREELASCQEELDTYKQKNVDLECQYNDLNAKFLALCEKTDKLKNTIERKDIEIATITKFFADRENELQTTTLTQTEEIQKLNKELNLITDDRRQVTELNKQINELKDELESNEKSFKQQVSTLEEESHANYLKMRTASRECEEHKREKEIYRKKLLENDLKPLHKNQSFEISGSSPVNASLDISDRSESPASNKSLEDQATASERSRSTIASVNPARPPMPFPPMFRGMPPFPPRPMGTPPFCMPPRPPFSGPPRPYMPVLRQPPSANRPGAFQATPVNNAQRGVPNSAPPFIPNARPPFNGQAYVNSLIDNLSTKDNVRKDLFEKQNKTVL